MITAGIRPVVLATGTPEWARQEAGAPRRLPCPPRQGLLLSTEPPASVRLARLHPGADSPPSADAGAGGLERAEPAALLRAPAVAGPLFAPARRSGPGGAPQPAIPVAIVTGGLTAGASRSSGGIPPLASSTRIYQLSRQGVVRRHRRPSLPKGRAVGREHDRQPRPAAARPRSVRRPGDPALDHRGGHRRNLRAAGGRPASAWPARARSWPGCTARRSGATSGRFLFYALRDSPTEGPKFEPFGVVRADLRPKPAYCYLASHLGGVRACGGEP